MGYEETLWLWWGGMPIGTYACWTMWFGIWPGRLSRRESGMCRTCFTSPQSCGVSLLLGGGREDKAGARGTQAKPPGLNTVRRNKITLGWWRRGADTSIEPQGPPTVRGEGKPRLNNKQEDVVFQKPRGKRALQEEGVISRWYSQRSQL